MMRLAAPIAIAALAISSPAMAQDQLTEEQVTALARYAMPTAFSSVQQRCTNVLASDAYIYTHGDNLALRLEAASEGQFEVAREALFSFAPSDGDNAMAAMLMQMPPEALEPFISEIIGAKILSEVNEDRCAQINRVLELVDPLPPENLARLIGFMVVEAAKEPEQEIDEAEGE